MIDWSRVLELREEVGEEDFDEVFELFLEEVEDALAPMRDDAFATETLEQDLHFLKGSAMSVGFSDFADLCKEGEYKARDGQDNQVSISGIVSVFDRSKAVFAQEKGDYI